MVLLPQLHKGLANTLGRLAHQTLPQHQAQNPHFGSMHSPHSLRHEPSRGIGGATASKQAARRVNLPDGGRFSHITEDVRTYPAEQALSEDEALRAGMEEKSKEFVQSGAEVYTTAI